MLLNFRSAFYTKAFQFQQKEKEIRKRTLEKESQQKTRASTKVVREPTFIEKQTSHQTLDIAGLQEYIMLRRLKGEEDSSELEETPQKLTVSADTVSGSFLSPNFSLIKQRTLSRVRL